MRRAITFLTSLLSLAPLLPAAPPTTSPTTTPAPPQLAEKGAKLEYLLYLPPDYGHGEKKWPLVLFLHGIGERGTDVQKVAKNGLPKLIKDGQDFPFIVVSPQCPPNDNWHSDQLLDLLRDVEQKRSVDTHRVYVTGLSMGGYATWALICERPDLFAAAIPMSGGGHPPSPNTGRGGKPAAIQSLGIWAFHGAKDHIVPLTESENMVAAFKQLGCTDTHLTTYPTGKHNIWTKAYQTPDLFDWLLKHSR